MKVLNESRQPIKAIKILEKVEDYLLKNITPLHDKNRSIDTYLTQDESNALKVMIDAFNDIGDAIEYLKGEE